VIKQWVVSLTQYVVKEEVHFLLVIISYNFLLSALRKV
jgi:hypothetical protein